MANPLMTMNNQQQKPKSIAEAFREFRQGFTGDADAKIAELVKSGQVTQQQVDAVYQLVQFARGMKK